MNDSEQRALEEEPHFQSEVMAGARRLILDAAAAQATTAMRARGLRPILIKGPAIERRVYPDGLRRRYSDVDLLVAPSEFDAATEVLLELRYRMSLPQQWLGVEQTEVPFHAAEFHREGQGAATIDLHRTIHWARVPPERVWSELSASTEPMTLATAEVEILGGAAQAAVVTLHAVQHGQYVPKPLDDLRYALDRLEESVWADGAQIAERIGAAEPFAAGLRMVSAGAALAERLGLTQSEPPEVRLLRDGEALVALALEQLVAERSWRGRARIAWSKLLPPPDYIRMGYPIAHTGRLGLIRGYGQRVRKLARRTPSALSAWRRARRIS